jgi:hypothetical protein
MSKWKSYHGLLSRADLQAQRDRALDLLDQSPMPANGNMLRADLLKWKYERDILLAECREEEVKVNRYRVMRGDRVVFDSGPEPENKAKQPTVRERVEEIFEFEADWRRAFRALADEIDALKTAQQ